MPIRIPVERLRAHALRASAAEQAQNVELVRALAKRDATAARFIEFFGTPRTIHPIAIVHVVQLPRAAERTARDEFAHRAIRLVITVRVPDLQHHARALRAASIIACASSSVVAIGFSHSTCLPAVRCRDDLRGVQIGRRRDIHGVDEIGCQQLVEIGDRASSIGRGSNALAHGHDRIADGGDQQFGVVCRRPVAIAAMQRPYQRCPNVMT